MKTYVMRSIRYIIRMAVIIGVVFAVLHLTNMLDTRGQSLGKALFMSSNGAILIGVLVLLAGIYPKLAFTTIRIHADMERDARDIADVMRSYGYSPVQTPDDSTVYRADKLLKRIASQFDDAITISGVGDAVEIEGLKKDVMRIGSAINAALRNK